MTDLLTHADEILIQTRQTHTGKSLGLLTLNRPKALNALNHNMIQMLYTTLAQWQNDPNIVLVVIQGIGERGFCAGGDIKSVYHNGPTGCSKSLDFFRDEYRLNRLIFHYSKPYVALVHGVTMGGGIGVSLHGSHRVGSPDLVLAMPETTIGFFPDVGGTYFLPRCPGNLGVYLGLTGTRIQIADALHMGLIDAQVEASHYPDLIDALCTLPTALPTQEIKTQITETIQTFETRPLDPPTLPVLQNRLDQCFQPTTVSEILAALRSEPQVFFQETADLLLQKSPISLCVTRKALHQAKNLSFDEAMKIEYQLTQGFLKHKDFYEGIRATLIDKDNQPQWEYASLVEAEKSNFSDYFLTSA
jgi:enoyl-CoA hydratase